MPTYFVTIAGNIGVGKSTLVSLLARKLGWEPVMEAVAENPYLADFYADMNRWSFHSQIFFLVRRLQQHHALLQQSGAILQDRSVYEDAEIFARNLYHQGYLSERDWNAYYELYTTLTRLLKPPDLVIYLRASTPTLRRRIEEMCIRDRSTWVWWSSAWVSFRPAAAARRSCAARDRKSVV